MLTCRTCSYAPRTEQPLTLFFVSPAWRHRCMLRVLDSFGTEPEFNHAHYAQSKGHKTPWGKWNLNPQQFNTMFRKSPAPLPAVIKGLVSFSSGSKKHHYCLCAGFM